MSNEILALRITDNPHMTIIEKVNIPAGDGASYQFLRDSVDGTIEAISGWTGDPEQTHPDVTFWGNDEAKLLGLPINEYATRLWWELDKRMVGLDYLSGVVVVTGGADENGDTLPVPDKVIELVQRGAS